jgi:hypothetical protein
MRRRVVLLSMAVACAALAPGDVRAARPGRINRGLVAALDSVGKNLFGSTVFTARTIVIDSMTWVVLDMAANGAVPALFRAIPPDPCTPPDPCEPPDPCSPLLSIGVDGQGGVTFDVDASLDVGLPPDPCADIIIPPGGDSPTGAVTTAPLASPAARAPNRGLVKALDSVGKNLFGRNAWAARTSVIDGTTWVVMDLSVRTAIPTLYDVFLPPEPCTYAAIVGVDGLGNGEQSLTHLIDEGVASPPEPCNPS